MDTKNETCSLTEVYSSIVVELAITRLVTKIASFGLQDACFVMILKGGAWVGFKILNQLAQAGHDVPFGFIGLQSYYEDTKTTGHVVTTSKPIFPDGFLKDKKVWVIDDIVENGYTFQEAMRQIKQLDPKELREVVLVDKPSGRGWSPEVVGLVYDEDGFLVGAGMGMGERFRNLSCICKVEGATDVNTG